MDVNLQRDPQSPPLAVAPDEKEVEKHNLTHTHHTLHGAHHAFASERELTSR
jgi:hypothetical protein